MNARPLPVGAILGAGVGLGFAGDVLLRAGGPPALNFALLFAGLAASVWVVSLTGRPNLGIEARVWLAVGVTFGATLVWRGSELLRPLAFLSAATAFALPALRAGRGWVRSAGIGDLVEAVVASGLHAGLGSFRLLQDASPGAVVRWTPGRSVARSAAVGVLLAALPLAVFGGLFMSADAVFAGIVGDFVRIDLSEFASHLALGGFLSWLACGYLAGFASGTRLEAVRDLGRARPALRTAEVAVALGLVDVLFLGFVAVQFRYLFGGHALVDVTPGLSYAAYAREGFFQLVAATALGLPWLLAADALVEEREGPNRWIFRGLAGAQLVLLLAIVASAVQRMRVYLDAYGLTEDRFVAMAVLGWSAFLVVWFGATVLRNRRRSFPFGALVSGLAVVMLLQFANPAGLAVRSHLDRADDPVSAGLDVRYLASLGSDAAPVLVARLDELDGTGRCLVARSLLRRWGPGAEWDWRRWNRADDRARSAVAARVLAIEGMAGDRDVPCEPAAAGPPSSAAPVQGPPGP